MHGVKRVRQSAQAIQATRLREKAKLDDYLALTQDILSRKKNKDWSQDALQLTSRLLQINPDFYTIWNYRRTILLNEEINTIITGDLSSTMTALKAHPKVYWIWNHRRWCLENTPYGPGADGEADAGVWRKANWDRELYVVEKMLDADPRNCRPICQFDLLRNAMYTDPNDQSVWMYHRWLMGAGKSSIPRSNVFRDDAERLGDDKDLLESEIMAIQELLDEQPDSKCVEFLALIIMVANDVH
ncbi:hypothetical protein C0991_009764 [Blastosporella zonata]|nr:hypothetical protein C0991_009764 [Blastosporella zonata]